MKKSIKIALLVAASLVVAGCITAAVAIALGGNFESNLQDVRHTVEGDPASIDVVEIDVDSADVRLSRSEDGTCYAVCRENDRIRYTLTQENGCLSLKKSADIYWYDNFGISIGHSPAVTLYLPKGMYEHLDIRTGSGNIVSEEIGISFARAVLTAESGSVRMSSPVSDSLLVTTLSGNIALADLTSDTLTATTSSGNISLADLSIDTMRVSSSSGSLSLSYVRAAALTASAMSGNVRLYNVYAIDTLDVKTTSGNIKLESTDAAEITLTASSGNINGTLLTGKLFDVQTGSGNVDCPPSIRDGGTCTVRTKSGNVKIHIAP